MNLTWHGHSCFEIGSLGERWVLDPYHPDMVPGLAPLKLTAHRVLCSHEHDDHNYREAVQVLPPPPTSVFSLSILESYHDDKHGKRRGTNRIHILDVDGLRLVHLGDLGHPLSKEDLHTLGVIDVLLVPIGGTYTINAKQAYDLVDQLQPRVIIPMHYRLKQMGFEVLEPLDDFLEYFPPTTIERYPTNSIDITPSTSPHVAVLTYLNHENDAK